MLDWDDTRIIFTKRELLNFLKLVLSTVIANRRPFATFEQ